MKLNLTTNRRNQSWLSALWDSLFWSSLPMEVQLLFGKYRIRFEAGSNFDPRTGRVSREFGTLRAFVGHCVYAPIFELKKMLSEAITVMKLKPCFGAIAYDAESNSGDKANVDPWSWTHVTTGSNVTGVVTVKWWDNGEAVSISSVKYATVAFTLGKHTDEAAYVYNADVWYLVNPTTGSNSAVVDFNSGSYGRAGMNTFSGTNTTTPVDNTAFTSTSGTSVSTNITTNNANSFIVDALSCSSGTVSVNSSQTTSWSSTVAPGGGSRKATTTAGVYAMAWSWTTSSAIAHSLIAINEAAAAATRVPLKALLGVGV